jgi:hypothetical protein
MGFSAVLVAARFKHRVVNLGRAATFGNPKPALKMTG